MSASLSARRALECGGSPPLSVTRHVATTGRSVDALPPLPGRGMEGTTRSGGRARSSLATGYPLAAPPGQWSPRVLRSSQTPLGCTLPKAAASHRTPKRCGAKPFGVRQPQLPLSYPTAPRANIQKRRLRPPHSKKVARFALPRRGSQRVAGGGAFFATPPDPHVFRDARPSRGGRHCNERSLAPRTSTQKLRPPHSKETAR